MTDPVIVVDYDERWPEEFERLATVYRDLLHGCRVAVEHVGSTSVPGLAAKPILDIDIVVPDGDMAQEVQPLLESLGYVCQGTLGIPGRWAYRLVECRGPMAALAPPLSEHHLYVVLASSEAWENHWRLREYLRSHPEAAQAYGDLKQHLSEVMRHDRDGYTTAKTDLIVEYLEKAGLDVSSVNEIRRVNTTNGDSHQ